MRVFVNGAEKEMLPRLYHDQLVRSAFGKVDDTSGYTVTWHLGRDGGSLSSGQAIKIVDGMRFEVARTDGA